MVCLEYLHSEALRVGLLSVAGIIRNAGEEIRLLDEDKSASRDILKVNNLPEDLLYAFHIFLIYMQADSKSSRAELLARLQNMETLFENPMELN